MKTRAYYAHCKLIYNRPQEERDMQLIRKLGFEPINPAAVEYIGMWDAMGMDAKEHFADMCDLIIFRGLSDSSIPAGVLKEIEAFEKRGKPVMEIPCGITRRGLTVEQTREMLREMGER